MCLNILDVSRVDVVLGINTLHERHLLGTRGRCDRSSGGAIVVRIAEHISPNMVLVGDRL